MGSEARSDFEPINSDHAVEAVTFSLALDRPLSPKAVASARSNHARWRSDLPAISVPQSFVVKVEDGVPRTQSKVADGIEFLYLRPDGSPAWVLRFIGNELTVECSRYTRWQQVWGFARRHLEMACDVIAVDNRQYRVRACIFSVLDRFRATNDAYDLKQLFKASSLIHHAAFSHGSLWHGHYGWFDQRPNARVLNTLNLDARREPFGSPELRTVEQGLCVLISHSQQSLLTNPLVVTPADAEGSKAFWDVVGEEMEEMHSHNKLILTELLTDEMVERIGLGEG
jgi:uncharacterized protein (TIGR04255 family)